MSVWKSPVFYFGILLLAVVGALLAAPYVVNWNGYKENLEAYGRRLTGRNVQIGGDIEIRLFPWPRLMAQQVAIGNPQGMEGAPLIHSEVMTLSLQLGGLLNGNLNVESVELLEPKVTLMRGPGGEVNWMLVPDEDLRRSTLLSNVRLDQIKLVNGSIRLDDRKQGFVTDISTIDADMSADAIEGPWRLKGTGYWREMPLGFTFSSGVYEDRGPFRFGLRVTPGDPSLPVFSIDGGWLASAFDGDVSVLPQASDGQKGSQEGGLRPLALRSRLKATGERADFTDIKIAPADKSDSGTLIEGTAGIDLGTALTGDISLKAPRVNLDTMLGAEALAAWRSGGALALSHALLRSLPEKVDVHFGLTVSVLTAGGETMNDVQLAAHVTPDGIAIDNARAGLPGRSAMRLTEGKVARKDGATELSGVLAFESSDLRAFAGWALPARKASFDSWWKGSRGRLKLQGNLAWSPSQMTFGDVRYELESLPGQGEVMLRQGQVPSLAMRLTTQSLDLDSLVAAGGAAAHRSSAFDLLGLLDPVLRGAETLEKHLVLDAGAVTLNGVRAQDVALDVGTSQSGFEIKAFDIGSVGGARVKAEGLVLSGKEGPSGDVTATLVAEDPRGFLRLLGLSDEHAQWTRSLGQTDVAFTFNAKPDPNGAILTYALTGTASPFTLKFTGGITELERGADARVSLEGTVAAADAARLLAVAGLEGKAAAASPGTVALSFSGSKSGGFASKMTGEAYGARLSFDGSLKPAEAYSAISGAASLFAEDVGPLLRALGVPQADGPGGPVRLAFKVTPREGGLAINDVVGDHAGLALAGEASFDKDGKLAADFNVGDVELPRLLALTFMPWRGSEVDTGTSFAGVDDLLFTGEIWLRPRSLAMPFGAVLKETAIGITVGETRRFALLAPTMPELEFDVSVTARDGVFDAKAKGKLPIDVAQVLKARDGTALGTGGLVISGELAGTGRSPAAALAALEGKGAYTLSTLALAKVAPEAFAAKLPAATSAEDLRAALAVLESQAGLSVETSGGSFTVSKGMLTSTPTRVSGIGTLSEITASADLSELRVEIATAVSLTERRELPPVTITYSGFPGALETRSSSSALASKLGHEFLARDLAELERLKTEQEKLALAEEEQRLQDVAKFEAYQAQRAEIRMRQRELKVHAAAREARAAVAAAEFAAFVPLGDAMNKVELAKQKLALGLKTRLAGFAEENARKARLEEERKRALEEKKKREEEARLKSIEEEQAKAEALRLKAIADEEARIAAEKAKAEEEARKAEEARLKAEAAAKALEEEKARQAAEKKKREEEALKKLEELPVSPVVPKPAVPPCEGIYC
jgi:hypothetical protein